MARKSKSDNGGTVKKHGWKFAQLPSDVILSKELTAQDVRLYAYILWRAGKDDHAWPRLETIADDLGVSVNTIKRAIDNLAANNWIRRQRRYGRSAITHIFETQLLCEQFDKDTEHRYSPHEKPIYEPIEKPIYEPIISPQVRHSSAHGRAIMNDSHKNNTPKSNETLSSSNDDNDNQGVGDGETHAAIWQETLALLKAQLTREAFRLHFLNTHLVSLTEGGAIVSCSAESLPWLDQRLKLVVQQSLCDVLDRHVAVSFQVALDLGGNGSE